MNNFHWLLITIMTRIKNTYFEDVVYNLVRISSTACVLLYTARCYDSCTTHKYTDFNYLVAPPPAAAGAVLLCSPRILFALFTAFPVASSICDLIKNLNDLGTSVT